MLKRILPILLVLCSLLLFTGCDDTTTMELVDSITTTVSTTTVSSQTDSKADAADETTTEQADTAGSTEESTTTEPTTKSEATTTQTSVTTTVTTTTKASEMEKPAAIDENGVYTTKEDVALYIHTYGCLPSNFITKKEAQALGWEGGSLEPYAPGKCIGGNYFGNYEGLLPEKNGRSYTECDIDTLGKKSRGAKRIVFSNDGLIYYTEDHYESFILLYGEEE